MKVTAWLTTNFPQGGSCSFYCTSTSWLYFPAHNPSLRLQKRWLYLSLQPSGDSGFLLLLISRWPCLVFQLLHHLYNQVPALHSVLFQVRPRQLHRWRNQHAQKSLSQCRTIILDRVSILGPKFLIPELKLLITNLYLRWLMKFLVPNAR